MAKKSMVHTKQSGISFTGERLVQNNPLLNPQRIENLARFQFFMNFLKEGKVLDFGCGVGEGTNYLNENQNYQALGIDISFDAVRYAKNQYGANGVDFICGDVTSPCLPKQTFDGLISIEVIEHLTDVDRFFFNITQLLKPQGVLFLTTPNQIFGSKDVKGLWPDHEKEYTIDELEVICKKYFKEVKMFGELIPVYEENIFRKIVRASSSQIKPLLPKWLRVRALPILYCLIRSNLNLDDVVFTENNIEKCPTLVAFCKGSRY